MMGLILERSFPLTSILQKIIAIFFILLNLFNPKSWNCWYFDTNGKEAPSIFQLCRTVLLSCFENSFGELELRADWKSCWDSGSKDPHRAGVGQTTGSLFPHKNVYSYFLFWKWLMRAWIKSWRGSITFVEKFTFAELSTLFFRISKQTSFFFNINNTLNQNLKKPP